MASITNPDINKISSINNKYHILLIYIIDEELGYYSGNYYDKSLKLTGFVEGKTLEEMYNDCYESLTMCMKDEDNVPFNVNDMKNSVVFDEIKCETDEEMDKTCEMKHAGKNFSEIIETIKK